MDVLKLSKLLADKSLKDQVAPFYIIEGQNDDSFEIFINSFISTLTPLKDHPDVLIIDLKKDESTYKVDSENIKTFFHFLNSYPLQLNKKIVFLKQSEKINDFVLNKMLKTLEELSSKFLIFFFTKKIEDILPTVRSRSISLKLEEKRQKLKIKTQVDLSEIKNQKDKNEEYEMTRTFLENVIETNLHNPSYRDLEKILYQLKHFEEASVFNNSLQSRLSIFNEK